MLKSGRSTHRIEDKALDNKLCMFVFPKILNICKRNNGKCWLKIHQKMPDFKTKFHKNKPSKSRFKVDHVVL